MQPTEGVQAAGVAEPLRGVEPATRSQARAAILFLIAIFSLLTWEAVRPHKWEYRIEAVPDLSFTQKTRELGQEGWELVTARRATGDDIRSVSTPTYSYEMVFKRPAPLWPW